MLKLTAHLCSIYQCSSNEIIIAYRTEVALWFLLLFISYLYMLKLIIYVAFIKVVAIKSL